MRPIRRAVDRGEVDAWALVLESQHISARVTRGADGWLLLVADRDFSRAARELDAQDRESPGGPPSPLPEPYGPTLAGLVAAAGLVAFELTMGLVEAPWLARGAADARAILDGELWRALTALTLHSDGPHLAANALFLAAFGTGVCWTLGPGIGLGLVVAAAVGANLANAALRGPGHVAVGASTAVFAAVGVLAGARFAHLRTAKTRMPSAWLPLAAGLALLGFLGSDPRTDVGAHLLGLVAGTLAGAGTAAQLRSPAGAAAQWSCLTLTGTALAAAWVLALAP